LSFTDYSICILDVQLEEKEEKEEKKKNKKERGRRVPIFSWL